METDKFLPYEVVFLDRLTLSFFEKRPVIEHHVIDIDEKKWEHHQTK